MRCLRCALDYGPEEQFCQRCGRALSRPLGSKPAAAEKGQSTPQEAQFFYTTTAPPPLQGAAQGTGEPVAWEMPKGFGAGVGAPAIEPPRVDQLAGSDDAFDEFAFPLTAEAVPAARVPAPAGPGAPPPPAPLDLSTHTGLKLKRATGGLSIDGNERGVTTEGPAMRAQAPMMASHIHEDFFGDGEEDEGSALLSSGSGHARSRASAYPQPRLSLNSRHDSETAARSNRRALPLVLIVLVVILALGGYAYSRQRAYNSDLTSARSLALGGPSRYPAAIAGYNRAIADWPFNSGAKDGLASVLAAENSVKAAAEAAARQLAQTDAIRSAMYDAHMALIQQELASQP
ncbi:MAG: hypothetical protein ACRDGS_06140 [Chloroflexota bacterium]